MSNIFHINVRHEPEEKPTHPFVLYNHDAIVGYRHVRGDGFPLKEDPSSRKFEWNCGFNRYKTKGEADAAAKRLQDYLDQKESKKRKKK